MFYDNVGRTRKKRSRNFRHITFIFNRSDGTLISYALNETARYESDHMSLRRHGEEMALTRLHRAVRRLSDKSNHNLQRDGVFLASIALTTNGTFRTSRPCLRCCGAISRSMYPVRDVMWYEGISDKFVYESMVTDPRPSTMDRNIMKLASPNLRDV